MHHRVWWEGSRSFGLPLPRNLREMRCLALPTPAALCCIPWVTRHLGYETAPGLTLGRVESIPPAVSWFFLGTRVLYRPAQTVVDPVHPLDPGIFFSLEQSVARVAVFEPSECNMQRGVRCIVRIIADTIQCGHIERETVVDRVPNASMPSAEQACFAPHVVE